jgi:hypothetical protein
MSSAKADAVEAGFSVREAAAATRLSEQAIYCKIRTGEIPHYRERGMLHITAADVKKIRASEDTDSTVEYIKKVLTTAPPLTLDQRERIADVLLTAPGGAK